MQFTTVQCIIRFLWGSARIGAGANAAEGILSPQIQFASPEPTASVSQLCKAASGLFQRDSVVSGWLGMGVVDDDGGIPGSFPPAGRLPSQAVAGARDAPITMRQTVGPRR